MSVLLRSRPAQWDINVKYNNTYSGLGSHGLLGCSGILTAALSSCHYTSLWEMSECQSESEREREVTSQTQLSLINNKSTQHNQARFLFPAAHTACQSNQYNYNTLNCTVLPKCFLIGSDYLRSLKSEKNHPIIVCDLSICRSAHCIYLSTNRTFIMANKSVKK